MAAAGFLSRYLNGPLPYVRCHIIVYKIFPSFLPSFLHCSKVAFEQKSLALGVIKKANSTAKSELDLLLVGVPYSNF